MIKKAKKAGLEVNIEHSPVNLIPQDADVVVAHAGLSKRAKEVAVNSVVISFKLTKRRFVSSLFIADTVNSIYL